MKVYLNKLAKIFADLKNKQIKALLLYGPNEALIYNTFNRLKKYLQLEVKSIPGPANIQANNLEIILSSTNLFGQMELIKFSEVGSSMDAKAVQILIQNDNNLVVILAKELAATSSLRKIFEAEEKLASLACYEEDYLSLEQFVNSYLSSQDYTIAASAANYLANSFGNREMLLNELNKITTCKANIKNITLEDVKEISFGSTSDELDLLCIDLLNNDASSYFNRLSTFDFIANSPIMIVRGFIRLYKNLYYLIAKREEGKSMQETAKTLKAPIFYKFLSLFLLVASKKDLAVALKGLSALYQLEKDIKFSPLDTNRLFEDIFFKINIQK